MKYVFGIDQGGSKTLAVLADLKGNILGTGRGAGACHSITGMDSAMKAISDAAQEALSAAEIAPDQIVRVAAGLTGVDWDYEAELLRENVSETLGIPQERIHVVNDCLIALRAGTSSASGCILCAGSGLNCGVRHPDGREYTFGYYIDDSHQGGAALGRRVLQTIYGMESGLFIKTPLAQRVIDYMGFESIEQMLMEQTEVGLDSGKVLYLPQILEQAALSGDAEAKRILTEFGTDIAQYVVAGLKRFDMQQEPTEIVLSGSVFKCRAPELLEAVRRVILDGAPNAKIVESEYEPVIGAALMALDHTGIDPEIQENIDRDAQKLNLVRKKKG